MLGVKKGRPSTNLPTTLSNTISIFLFRIVPEKHPDSSPDEKPMGCGEYRRRRIEGTSGLIPPYM